LASNNNKKRPETAILAFLSPVRLPFRHTGKPYPFNPRKPTPCHRLRKPLFPSVGCACRGGTVSKQQAADRQQCRGDTGNGRRYGSYGVALRDAPPRQRLFPNPGDSFRRRQFCAFGIPNESTSVSLRARRPAFDKRGRTPVDPVAATVAGEGAAKGGFNVSRPYTSRDAPCSLGRQFSTAA
jgi:hypothetical protein